MSDDSLWAVSILILFVVSGIVALLLLSIIRVAREIDHVAAGIWTTGQRVANNTVHIPTLYKVGASVESIGGRAPQILASAKRIRAIVDPAQRAL